jgi:N-acetyltransferase
MNWLEPVTLTGRFVRLEPLQEAHAETMLPYLDARAFAFMHGRLPPTDLESLKTHFNEYNLRSQRMNWAVRWLETNAVAGRISFSQVNEPHFIEIGTMLMPTFWGGQANSESKYLLLRHAFETLGVPRVQFSGKPPMNARNGQWKNWVRCAKGCCEIMSPFQTVT